MKLDLKDAALRMQAERDAARSARLVAEMALRDAHAELEAARMECERLRSDNAALIARRDELLALCVKVTRETPYPAELDECKSARAQLIAKVGTLRSELSELRGQIAIRDPPPSPHADRLAAHERQKMTARIYDLLATEPAVSEERCREIDGRAFEASHDVLGEVRWFRIDAEPTRVYWSPVIDGRDTCVPQSYADMFRAVDAAFAAAANPRAVRVLIAAARQLHALRAELAQIVGGGLTDSQDKAGPIAWAATGSRVTALKWIAERLAGAAMDPERDREAAQVIAGLLSETSP